MNINLIAAIEACTIITVPLMVAIIWFMPKILNSNLTTKILIGAIIISAYMALIVVFVDSSSLQIQNIRFVAILTAVVWGGLGFLVGIYFDVRLRMELGTRYYQEFTRLQMYGVTYGIVGAIISLPVGIIAGWLVVVLGASLWGLLLSIAIGSIFGGVLGWVLDQRS